MKSKIFVDAAESVFNQDDTYSCIELTISARRNGLGEKEIIDLKNFYSNVFNLRWFDTFYVMYTKTFDSLAIKERIEPELKEMRVFALLLAGEIFKSEKKSLKKSKFKKN